MRAEIQRFRGFADEKYFFCSYYKMKTSSKNRRLPLRTGGKTAGKKGDHSSDRLFFCKPTSMLILEINRNTRTTIAVALRTTCPRARQR